MGSRAGGMPPAFPAGGGPGGPVSSEGDAGDTLSKLLKKDILPTYDVVNDAIRHDNLRELLKHVEGPVNLSEDPLLSVVIACGKSKLAIKLLANMPPEKLMDKNFNDDTALHVAAEMGDESVVEALVKKNRDLLGASNKQLEIPLHKAALFGRRRIFWDLVRHGSNARANREDGATMLHCAVVGKAPELALEIAKEYRDLMTRRNSKAVTPLQLMVTIPEAFPSQSHLGPIESLIYDWIPLEERHKKPVEESSVRETSDPRYKDNECLQLVRTSRRKLPPNYASFFDMLELACIPVRWARILVFNILKQLSTRIQDLELQKKNHKQAMELIAYLAKDLDYWDFIDKGRKPSTAPSEYLPTPPDMISKPPTISSGRNETSKSNENQRKQGNEKLPEVGTNKKLRWNESPLILGAALGLHEFVKQILTVCPASASLHDTEGRNVLQVAILHGQEKIVEIIESMATGKNPVLPSWLLSEIEKTTQNTILHYAAVKTVQENFPATQMQYELQWFERVKRLVRKDLDYSRNQDELTAQELFNEEHKIMVQNGKEQLMEMGKTYSSLVAAVVFASSFSIPGDKDANNNPVFLHKTAFKVFSHAYVIGLSCAATALVLFLSLLTSPYRVQEFRRSIPTKYFFANVSFSLALVALLVAFTCNIYLNIYGGRKAQTKDLVPLVCELTIFPVVCLFVLLYRGASFGFGSFTRRVWR
ncbi:uncharacterized protein LOC103711819 [Phoenix dactylifera]|uniref:Uncharacterized protein LOC103711819 n=1 Tax=Phoenix dactylifera TaxID=42345 RepID=A0A8B8J737_PHODC|nr:uncharacterized protein LOC103711819 [Phoenix dactylifera]